MASWASESSPAPSAKYEVSPAESFLSAPGEGYPSLFDTPSSTSMNPLDIMTPQSFAEEEEPELSVLAGLAPPEEELAAQQQPATSEKRPSKKRKSWGQVLPEPKTNLPPRKRAKTDDEKEQRRVERVLRNRRAAQSSRERKRLEVEALEQRNKELEAALLHARKTNILLVEELSRVRRDSGVAPSFESFRPDPVTLSQQLFSSQDSNQSSEQAKPSLMDELLISARQSDTVNPASLSPALTPIPEAADDAALAMAPDTAATHAAEAATAADASPDLTQHPAEVLCFDLQSFPFPTTSSSQFDLFDINEFLNNDDATAPGPTSGIRAAECEYAPTLGHPEAQIPPKDPSLQPRPGASTFGCDDGGIAVGVI